MNEGTEVGGYRVLKQIGEGGMGSVWLAEHVALGRRAALKVLHPEYSTRRDIVTRFFNEARAANVISDPGIVQIFDHGQHSDGCAYLVMELLEGEPLDRRLKREGALTVVETLRLMRQIASTLGAAHACGVVHRDLKPENIYIVRDAEVPGGERAKVLDFGIAKLVGEVGVKTNTAAVMGTPAYMSPEQCRGAGQVDQRSDVYALGCVLFTTLVGRPPFVGEGAGDVIAMHLREPAPLPSQLRPGIPPEIDQLVSRCLEKNPAQRFSSAEELALAIGGLLGSSPQLPADRTRDYVTASTPTTLSGATVATGARPATRSRIGRIKTIAAIAAIATVTAAAASLAVVILVHRAGDPRQRVPAQPAAAVVARPPAPAPLPAPAKARPPDPAPDPRPAALDPAAQAEPIIQDALTRFLAWSREHPSASCPDVAVLGAPHDPWGHPLAITCTDQPGDQIAGAISAGPDGQLGTGDDVKSWQLGRDVTDRVHGARWTAARPRPAAKPAAPARPRSGTLTPAAPADASAKPAPAVQLDENGLPITR